MSTRFKIKNLKNNLKHFVRNTKIINQYCLVTPKSKNIIIQNIYIEQLICSFIIDNSRFKEEKY